MSTLLICQDCGGVRGATETTEAGEPCRCDHPAPSSTIYGASPGVKICCICGSDVTGKQRMKDREGRYFCYDCGMQDSKRKHGDTVEMCADCHRPMNKDKMKLVEGHLICDKCDANRAVKAKREQSRRAYAELEQQEERKKLIRQIVIGAVVLLLLVAGIWLMSR